MIPREWLRPAALLLFLWVLGRPVPAEAQNPPGTLINNVATATYGVGARDGLTRASNTVALVVVPARSGSSVEFLRYHPGVRSSLAVPVVGSEFSASGDPSGPFRPLAEPVSVAGAPIDISRPVPLETAALFAVGDPVFLRLVDPDQNREANSRDSILVTVGNDETGDRELLRLYETGNDRGEFLGFVQTSGGAAQPNDGRLSVAQDQSIQADYTDVRDAGDNSRATARFDPVGRVFDSRTGAPIDGVTVRLIDDATGYPAAVTGNDAGSVFPNVLTTGQTVTDGAGVTYDFGPGGFRFPHVASGRYRLEMTPPPGYRAPSRVTDPDLATLPGAPFAILTPGSRGEPFAMPDHPLWLDLPLDRVDTDLFVTKTAGKSSVAVGDFLAYEVKIANATSDDASRVTVTDRLPAGFRFQAGSVLVDGLPDADPVVAPDGRTLVFTRAELAAGRTTTIRYLVGVGPGAPAGDAVNRATATWAQVASNEATALVEVRRDLFGDSNTILGRVRGADCEEDSAAAAKGIAGVRVYLETGAFAVTDEQGRYHIAGIAPGAHVVQMDLASLPADYVPGDCSGDSLANVHPWSHLVDLQGGTMWRSDFTLRRLPPTTGSVVLTVDTTLRGTSIRSTAEIATARVPLRNVRLTVALPEGVVYSAGSSSLDERPLPDPAVTDGTLVYKLDELAADQTLLLGFGAAVQPPLARADLALRSLVTCDTPTQRGVRSKVVRTALNLVPEVVRRAQPEMILRPRFPSLGADLSARDLAGIDSLLAALDSLEITAVKVVGHTDSQRIRPGASALYADNHALSLARARAVGDHIAARLHLTEAQLSIYGMGAREPVADNATPEGRARNRRVSLQVWTAKVAVRLPDQAVTDHQRVDTPVVGFRPGAAWPETGRPAGASPDRMPDYDTAWLATAPSGERILWPPAGHLPHLPACKLAVQHAGHDSVRVAVNGVPADRANFAGRIVTVDGGSAVSIWTGLDLIPGDNTLSAEITDPRGRLVRRLERVVHYSGPPVRAEVIPGRSVLVADGRTRPVVALRLTDADGFPARRDVVGTFSVAAPHQAWRAKGDSERESLSAFQENAPSFTVGGDGVALLRLAPTSDSGEAVLRIGLADHEEELRVWLQPAGRDWILAGVAEGSLGYNIVAGNLEAGGPQGPEAEFYSEGRLAFFAKGRLKGKWLLTMAYDSRDPERKPVSGLFDVVDPDAYYTVYGDAVVQGHDAPSGDRLYIRLERRQFYALYGDFRSGLTLTELTRYNRAMTGFRASRRGDRTGYDVFASRNRQNYRRDELRGDGTSGLYHLTAGRILPHSEKVTRQVRDRYRSERILSAHALTRSVDYSLDDLDGTLYFNQPVPSQDENFNPVWIVVEYETETGSGDEFTGGGRASWRPGAGPVELGATGIREGLQGGRGDIMAGVDSRWDLGPALRLTAEFAASDTRRAGRREAWSGELSRRTGPVLGRLYYHDRPPGFGLGHENASERAARKFGLDARWNGNPAWRLDGTFFLQRDRVSSAERQFAETRLGHTSRAFTAGLGLRAANDEQTDGTLRQSRQVTADASLKFLARRGRVRVGREQGFHGQDEIADLPTRTALGLEYEVFRDQKIFLAQEYVADQDAGTSRTRLGVESVPWRGGRLVSAAERSSRESARRVFGSMGLKQNLRLNANWSLEAGLDHGQSSGSLADSVATATDTDFTAANLGATHRAGPFLIDQRLEYRTSDRARKWGLAGGLHVEPSRSLGLLANLRLVRTDFRPGGHHYLSDVSLGLSWRPADSPWTVLQRVSYRTEDKTGDPAGLSNWRVVNNLNLLRRIGARDQLSTLIGVRYNRDTIAARRYADTSDRLGLEWRHFIGKRWDLGLRAASRHIWRGGVVAYSAGVSGGYRLLEDIWLSLGYNFTGFRDRDFSVTDYTAQGPYLRFRVRLNQETTHEMLR